MSSLLSSLRHLLAEELQKLGFSSALAEVLPSQRPDLGQFQTNCALALSTGAQESARSIAEKIAEALKQQPQLREVSVAGPGFINFSLQDEWLAQQLNQTLDPKRLGLELPLKGQKIVIDFGGPNVAKPLHVGHLRSSIIGDSLRRVYGFLGAEIYGDIHLGDWGTPMGLLIALLGRRKPDLPYFQDDFSGSYPENSPVEIEDLEELYPEASRLAKEDEAFKKEAAQATAELQSGRAGYLALWKHFIAVSERALKENFEALGVYFDWWYGESHYQNRIAPLIQRLKSAGLAEESQGALIIPLQPVEGRELPPLILVKSDGASLYATTDLAAVEERAQVDKAQQLLYVVDQRQSLHFTQVFQAARQTGLAPAELDMQFIGFGTVNGPDGKPFKTREGGIMKLKELIAIAQQKALERMQEAGMGKEYPPDEQKEVARRVGIAALKFADLINNRLSDYQFDLDRFTQFEGKTGPYLVYTAVRIKSILRRLGPLAEQESPLLPPTELERELMLHLASVPEVIERLRQQHAPHVLAEYLYQLAQAFNRFYQKCSILHEPDPVQQQGWICLLKLVLTHFELLLDLLGIEIPERM